MRIRLAVATYWPQKLPNAGLKCGAPWARRYVPGSAESGSALPAETTRAALTCPPNRASWVAQYRNPELQGASKRPTRSKSYRNIPEHRAFQVALDWLWSRHELCCRPVQSRPSWVVDVLAACPHCAVGDPCNFMDTVRSVKLSHGPSGTVESGESSFWEAEGTSDSLSSEAPKVTRPVSKRFKGKQCPPKSLHSPSGHGPWGCVRCYFIENTHRPRGCVRYYFIENTHRPRGCVRCHFIETFEGSLGGG